MYIYWFLFSGWYVITESEHIQSAKRAQVPCVVQVRGCVLVSLCFYSLHYFFMNSLSISKNARSLPVTSLLLLRRLSFLLFGPARSVFGRRLDCWCPPRPLLPPLRGWEGILALEVLGPCSVVLCCWVFWFFLLLLVGLWAEAFWSGVLVCWHLVVLFNLKKSIQDVSLCNILGGWSLMGMTFLT